jgi:hypothetical protein
MTDEQQHEASMAIQALSRAANDLYESAKKPEFVEYLWEHREMIRAAQDDLRAALFHLALDPLYREPGV